MEARIVGYLEEYARELRAELDALMDRSLNDGDERAGTEALEIGLKIRDIKQIIKRFAAKRAGDGNRTHVSTLEGSHSTIEPHPRN